MSLNDNLSDRKLNILNVKKVIQVFSLTIFSGIFFLTLNVDLYNEFTGITRSDDESKSYNSPVSAKIKKINYPNYSDVNQGSLVIEYDQDLINLKLQQNIIKKCVLENTIDFMQDFNFERYSKKKDLNSCWKESQEEVLYQNHLLDEYKAKKSKLQKNLFEVEFSIKSHSSELKIAKLNIDIINDKVARYSNLKNRSLTSEAEFFELQQKLNISTEAYEAEKGKHGQLIYRKEQIEESINELSSAFKANTMQRSLRYKEEIRNYAVNIASYKQDIKNLNIHAYTRGALVLNSNIYEGAFVNEGQELFKVTSKSLSSLVSATIDVEVYSRLSLGDNLMIRVSSMDRDDNNIYEAVIISKYHSLVGHSQIAHTVVAEITDTQGKEIAPGETVSIKHLDSTKSIFSLLFYKFWEDLLW